MAITAPLPEANQEEITAVVQTALNDAKPGTHIYEKLQ